MNYSSESSVICSSSTRSQKTCMSTQLSASCRRIQSHPISLLFVGICCFTPTRWDCSCRRPSHGLRMSVRDECRCRVHVPCSRLQWEAVFDVLNDILPSLRSDRSPNSTGITLCTKRAPSYFPETCAHFHYQ